MLLGAPALTAQQSACTTAPFRSFDFWLGHWKVSDSTGKVIGSSVIDSSAGGCVINEQWHAMAGDDGTSMTWYDSADNRWHQQYVSSAGHITRYTGVMQAGTMLFDVDSRNPTGTQTRVVLARMSEGRVRHSIELSDDYGVTWRTDRVTFYLRQR